MSGCVNCGHNSVFHRGYDEGGCYLCDRAGHVPICLLLPGDEGFSPSPEARDLRHAGHARLMEPEGPGHRGYVKGDGPE